MRPLLLATSCTLALMAASGCSRPTSQPTAAPAQTPATDAAAIQHALDQAAASGGGVVQLGPKHYRLDKSIVIPEGVTLAGTWQGPHHAQPKSGTVFEVFAGKGDENGPPLVLLNPSTTIQGITFFYPEQTIPPIAYPWTIQGRGMHGNIIDCTFVNPYKAIDFGTYHNELHYIRNCFGCPLKIGVHIDQCSDIGRIENVHFNPHYWVRSGAPGAPDWGPLRKYLFENLVAFEFGRSDWEYVLNTFCFGGKIGYRFYKSDHVQVGGTVNGNFLGIGADWCNRAIYVEDSQTPGLLITNGEFVGGEGSDAMVELAPSQHGVVQFSNCAFWGPCPTAALIGGRGSASFSQCNFLNHGPRKPDTCTIDAQGGDVTIQACRFNIDAPDIRLGELVRTAVITGNWFKGSKDILNTCKGDVQEGLNVVAKPPATKPS